MEEKWERDSIDAWNYEHTDLEESWTIVAHKVGTAGTLDTYAVAYECRNNETGEWSLIPTHQVFIGTNAKNEIYEYIGL